MMNIKIEQIKDKLILACIFLVGVAVLDIFFHSPENVKNFVESNLSKTKQVARNIQIPDIPKLESYLSVLEGKKVFVFKEEKQSRDEGLSDVNIGDYIFNGIVVLKETRYLAIYKKSDKSQYLVPEGQIFEGMKVKKIGENTVVLELRGGKEKEVPLYSNAPSM